MKALAMSAIFLFASAALAQGKIAGEVDCSKGGEIVKVKALVKKAHESLKKNREGTLKEITEGNKSWKDGDFYVYVYEHGKVLAHGFNAAMVGRDLASVKDADSVPYVDSLRRIALEKGEGCIQYKFPNPAKGGQVEDKIGYVMKVDSTTWVGSGTYFVK